MPCNAYNHHVLTKMDVVAACVRRATCCETRGISIFKAAVSRPVIRRIIPQMESSIYQSVSLGTLKLIVKKK